MALLKSQAVGDWEVCGDAFFSRELLYDMGWQDVDLEEKRVCCSPFGGPIATIRDERRMVVVTGGSTAPVLRTFSAAGAPLGVLLWERGPIVDWGWSEELELLLVEASGRVSVLSMHCEKLREFSMGQAVEREGVAAARVYASGVVVVTTGNPNTHQHPVGGSVLVIGPPAPAGGAAAPQPQAAATPAACSPSLWAVTNLREPRPSKLAAVPGMKALPQAFAVLEPRFTLSTGLEVLVALKGGNGVLWQVDDQSATDHRLQHQQQPAAAAAAAPGAAASTSASFLHVSVSPDGQFVAMFAEDGRLLVMVADLTRALCEFETRADSPPLALHWCGSDAVLLQWPELLLLVGPHGDHCSWQLAEEALTVVPEVDGARLLSSTRHELLRKVPDCLVQVFRPGSTSPAAQLWDARDLLDQESPRCDKVLRTIQDAGQDELPGAVRACIEAAGQDLAGPRQAALMRAAAFGRPFCPPSFPHQLMHGTACRLRVLNALREPGVGLPLTMGQLEALGLPVVVARLISYRQWLLAYRIAGFLKSAPGLSQPRPGAGLPPGAALPASGLPPGSAQRPGLATTTGQDQVLIQWACAKISAAAGGASASSSASLDDQALRDEIVTKLKCCPEVRYAPLAAHAQAVGRRRLALLLLEEEASAAAQVPLLLSLAVGSGRAGERRPGQAGPPDPSPSDSEDVLQRALRKSIESGDTDLVYLVLFTAYRARPLPEFWALVSSRALARNLFIKYCRAKEPELLETILATNSGAANSGATAELAGMTLHGALQEYEQTFKAGDANEVVLSKLCGTLMDVSHKYGQVRECAFQSKAVGEMAALRKEQARIERESGQRLFVGLSLVDTLRACIRLGHHKTAAALKKQFAVSDRRFCWLKLRTLAEARDWEGVEGYALELKARSPIGWEPFLEVAKKWGAPREYQARLLARQPDTASKAEEYAALGFQREAAEVAAKLRDSDLFARIQSAVAAGSPAGLAIAQIKERFQSTFR